MFQFDGGGMLKMRTRNTDSNGVNDDRTFAFLNRQGPGSAPPPIDKEGPGLVRTNIPPYWPAQRKADAEWLYKSISAL